MQDLIREIDFLYTAIKEFKANGIKKAATEQEYRIALNQKILIERDNGVPVTIIGDICRGDKEIARKKFDRDVAEVMYRASEEAIRAQKIKINILADFLKQGDPPEW